MGYINAEKLIAEIERLRNQKKKQLERFSDEDYCCSVASSINCELSGNLEVLSIIKSLQQEQPKVDLVEELKHYLDTTPREQLEKDWKELEPYGNIGPTVQEFLYGNQPEMDLEKFTEKIKTFQERYKHPEIVSIKGSMAFMARMFYQYPNVARKWYDSLPKAIMD